LWNRFFLLRVIHRSTLPISGLRVIDGGCR
jgi:hypothetical protein